MALSMTSVVIPGGFRGNAGIFGKIWGLWVVSGDLGGQKASAQIASSVFETVVSETVFGPSPRTGWPVLGSLV